jgi:YD repeat-containing protein
MIASNTIRSSTYTWDFENRLTSVSFRYDPFGRRIQKTWPNATNTSATTMNYLYDGAKMTAELSASGAGGPLNASFVEWGCSSAKVWDLLCVCFAVRAAFRRPEASDERQFVGAHVTCYSSERSATQVLATQNSIFESAGKCFSGATLEFRKRFCRSLRNVTMYQGVIAHRRINSREGNPFESCATMYHSTIPALETIITIVNRIRRRQ